MRDRYALALQECLKPLPSDKLPGWERFNRITGGFRPKEFTILCGGTGTGKTTLLANWSAALIRANVPHFVASVETGDTDYIRRVMSVYAGQDINSGEAVDPSVLKQIDERFGSLMRQRQNWISLYDNRFSVEQLIADLTEMHEKHGTRVAFIDNLNFFLEITSEAKAVYEMDRVIHDLIIFTKRVPMHVVMVMHPKKTEGGRIESEFDIKGSSTAVQEAHNVLLFNHPHPQLLDEGIALEGQREIKVAKMRRRGTAVGARLLLASVQGVKYDEFDVLKLGRQGVRND